MQLLSNQLQLKQQELEKSRNRYVDLYDHAPVGYLTLDNNGRIFSINLTGASLLKAERHTLIGKIFSDYFANIDKQAFVAYLQKTFSSSRKTSIDLKIGNIDDVLSYVRLESTVISSKNMCRMMMSDISQLKKMINLNHDLLIENRQLMKELFRIQEKERRLLARELHDALGQWLTAIRVENEVILNHTDKKSIIFTSAQAIKECTEKMHQVIRNMLHRLRPILLDTLGLPDALYELKKQWISHNAGTILRFELNGNLSVLGERLNINIFRLIQEGLNNAYKHADASQIDVFLSRETIMDNPIAEFLLLKIKDNGKGFNFQANSTGLGLVGMRERVITLDGRMVIKSAKDLGTEITIRLPFFAKN
ncbi:two-component system, NarL family, nitrate/nitrite sensor histidine kinase NarX/two-component system, NarL family, sensor histidine kinase UhpB [Nitrosomonas sp. PY1]|nr:two-component system, NarL family, nitrate/nitrite sensor histidine kinase NarX/two-component system, NarL family, sensor histidine kinase UhpB [Nitrosomonas sp. PY1]